MDPILFKHVNTGDINQLDVYVENGGYRVLKQAVTEMQPSEVIEGISASGLAGRGGAGFPTGRKWSFIPTSVAPTYLEVNGDESELGAFKDRELMERNPHQLLEGMAIASYAIGCRQAFVYLRGEFLYIEECLNAAIAKAKGRGYLGQNLFGSGFDLDIVVHRGAGAYICGEETALLDSLEGYEGFPDYVRRFPP